MRGVIWKYPLAGPETRVLLQRGARVLAAGLDPEGEPCVWATVDPERREYVARTVLSVNTGGPAPDDRHSYIASFTDMGVVWHVFVGPEVALP